MVKLYKAEDLPTTVVMHFDEAWSWNEFYMAMTDAHIMIEALAPLPVTFLVRHDVKIPNGNTMLHFRNAFQQGPDNIHQIVMVSGPNTMLFSLYETASRMFNPHLEPDYKIILCDSYEEALNHVVKGSAAC